MVIRDSANSRNCHNVAKRKLTLCCSYKTCIFGPVYIPLVRQAYILNGLCNNGRTVGVLENGLVYNVKLLEMFHHDEHLEDLDDSRPPRYRPRYVTR